MTCEACQQQVGELLRLWWTGFDICQHCKQIIGEPQPVQAYYLGKSNGQHQFRRLFPTTCPYCGGNISIETAACLEGELSEVVVQEVEVVRHD